MILLWDFGLNPTCVITQLTPLGFWNILEAYVGEEIGAFELISQVVKPRLEMRFHGLPIRHIGDPAGQQREQSSSQQSAVKVIKQEIGGPWRPGRTSLDDRVNPLAWALTQTRAGRGMLQVDRRFAKPVWLALRGGWHYHVSRTGVASSSPTKNIHSHPGDAMGYGASRLFPQGRIVEKRVSRVPKTRANYWKGLGFERPGLRLPKEAQTIETPDKPAA